MTYEEMMETRAGREWEDGDDSALWDAGYQQGRAEMVAQFQRILDDCARNLDKLHDWAERTSADRESHKWGHQDGMFQAHYSMAYFVIGVAHSAGLTLNDHRLNRALSRGDFL